MTAKPIAAQQGRLFALLCFAALLSPTAGLAASCDGQTVTGTGTSTVSKHDALLNAGSDASDKCGNQGCKSATVTKESYSKSGDTWTCNLEAVCEK